MRWRSEHGQILVFSAVSLVALMGIAALSIDAAYMYDRRNKLYAAADAAAKSAAFAYKRDTTSDLCQFALHEVNLLGLTPAPTVCFGTSGTVVEWYHPPAAGPFTGNSNYVEVRVSQPSTSTFFGKVLGWMSANPGARAVAGTSNPTNCMIINQDLSLGNTCPHGSGFNVNGCGVAVGGNLFGTNPNACITGTPNPPVDVGGTCSGTCGAMGDLTTGTNTTPVDPFVNLPAFSNPYGSCIAGVGATLSPGCYTSIATSVTTLQPGEYYITGTINVGASLTGNGVFLYVAGGHFHSANNNSLNLTAMSTAGTYSGNTYIGVAVFQERGDIQNFDAGNNFSLTLRGAMYMPSVDVNFANSLSFVATDCSIIVAKSLTIANGSGTLSNNGCVTQFGGASFLSTTLAE